MEWNEMKWRKLRQLGDVYRAKTGEYQGCKRDASHRVPQWPFSPSQGSSGKEAQWKEHSEAGFANGKAVITKYPLPASPKQQENRPFKPSMSPSISQPASLIPCPCKAARENRQVNPPSLVLIKFAAAISTTAARCTTHKRELEREEV